MDSESNDEEISIPKPTVLLNALHDTECLLMQNGKFELCDTLHTIMNAVKVHDHSLKQKDICDFLI